MSAHHPDSSAQTIKLIIIAVVLAVAALFMAMTVTVDVKLSGWSGCSATTEGRYGALATIDWRGFVHPFGRLNFDEPGEWRLAIHVNDAKGEATVVTADKFVMNTLKGIRFACSGGDKGTPDGDFEIVKDGRVVYDTGFMRTAGIAGLQNSEFGFAPVAWTDVTLYRLILDGLPQAVSKNDGGRPAH